MEMRLVSRYVLVGLGFIALTGIASAQCQWSRRNPLPAFKTLQSVTWTGSQVVAVGDSGTVITSPNGLSWEGRVSGVGANLFGVASSSSRIVAVGAAGTIVASADGVAWQLQASGVTAALYGVTWTGSLFVAVGAGGTVITSPD